MPRKLRPDMWLLVVAMLLLSAGVVMVYSASAIMASDRFHDPYLFLKKQLFWALLGAGCLVAALRLDYRRLERLGWPILIAAGVLLILVLVLAPALPMIGLAVWLAPYRLRRITTFLDPWSDPRGSGFQIIQSWLALGSGGLLGRGMGESRQKLFYLPEAHTDFIFAVVGEELGFLGATLVVGL